MGLRRPGAMAMALLGVVSMSACGAAPGTKTVTVTAPAPEPAATAAPAPKSRSAPDGGRTTPRRPKTVLTACDANVRAKAATTTCGFAENVFYEYWRRVEYGEVSDIQAFSAALKTFLRVDCKHGDAVVCRTSAGAVVRFSVSAVNAYTLENATQYARSHRVTKSPHRASQPKAPPDDGGTDCDPSYEGACLDASSSDYDCEGGSGDGPDYTGTVRVVGDDHFGLDRDGDSVGCDS